MKQVSAMVHSLQHAKVTVSNDDIVPTIQCKPCIDSCTQIEVMVRATHIHTHTHTCALQYINRCLTLHKQVTPEFIDVNIVQQADHFNAVESLNSKYICIKNK